MGRPRTPKIPPPPPPPPIQPLDPVFGTTELEKTKQKLLDPSRVGRRQTIVTSPRGLLAPESSRKKLGSGDTTQGS